MQEEAINILIVKCYHEDCSAAERAALEQWLAESESNRKHYDEIVLIEKQLLQMDFGLEAKTETGWAELQSRIAQAPKVEAPIRRTFSWLRIAAAAVVVIATLWAAQHYIIGNDDAASFAQRYHVPAGQTQQIELPDGSTVLLNAGSEMQLANDFNQSERRIRLQGEGFFEIAKDASKAFIIESGELRTEVLGTAFQLSAYPSDSEMNIAVTAGKVSFSAKGKKSITLTPGQGATYHTASKKIESKEIQVADVDARKQRELVFRNTPFRDALNELERRFNVQISDDAGLSAERLSSRFSAAARLQEVLEQLAILYDLDVQQDGKEIILRKK